jgi:DNA helicase-2/ATP-dependent DNA helicase PcrA
MALAKSISYDLFSKMYVEKAQLIDDKKQNEEDAQKKGTNRAPLIRHLYKIMQIIESYQNKHLAEFFRITDMPKIKRASDKALIGTAMESLREIDNQMIGEVIKKADETRILRIDDKLAGYKDTYQYIYERVCALPFREFHCLYDYLEGRTPFSTQHKTKGAEFNNVFLLMDNANWNQYNFNYLMSGTPRGKSEKPRERTNKLFYVCCTRAKEALIMYFPNPSESDLMKAKEWFGDANVKAL